MRDEKTVNIPDEWLVPTVPNEDALAYSPGRYRLCFEVASGGMATVYLALYSGPLGFERVVALKTIHRHLAKEQQFVDMFLDEARIAAHIDHPFVCKVVDFGEARDTYYIAMEYLLGEPLSFVWEALQEKPALRAAPDLPFLLTRLGADLAEGLHAAHELTDDGKPMDIVHRDVTPANLFCLYDGTVRVVDFGIAKAENKIHHTETGTVKGKYAYLSPEQLNRQPVDRRSDVFSLGVVLWELLTGQRLFKRESPMETMRAVSSAEVPPPSDFRDDIPAELNRIVLKALAKDPARRQSSARELADELEACLAEHGRTVPRSALSEWMDDLFPGEVEKKRRLVEQTWRGDTAVRLDEPERRVPKAPLEATTVRVQETEAEIIDEEEGHSQEDEPTHVAPPKPARPPSVQSLPDEPETGSDEADAVSTSAEAGPSETSSEVRAVGGAALRRVEAGAETEKVSLERREPSEDAEPTSLRVRNSDHPGPRPSRRSSLPVIIMVAVALFAGGFAAFRTMEGGQSSGGESATVREETVADEDVREGEEETPPAPLVQEPQETELTYDPDGEPGTVQVRAPGGAGAEIWERGLKLGRTDEDIELPPGLHQLELRPDDYSASRVLEVEVRSGRRVYASFSAAE